MWHRCHIIKKLYKVLYDTDYNLQTIFYYFHIFWDLVFRNTLFKNSLIDIYSERYLLRLSKNSRFIKNT